MPADPSTRRPVRAALIVVSLTAVLGLALTGCGVQTLADQSPATQAPAQSTAPSPSASDLPTTASPSETTATTEPSSTPTTKPTDQPTEKPTQKPTQKPAEPEYVLAPGDTGEKVRELQVRLVQLDWFTGAITGSYGSLTTAGVQGFQDKRGYSRTGKVDAKTWAKLVSMTRTPTHDEKYNVLKPGPAIMKKGSTGTQVRQLQARLKQLAWFSGNVTDTYGDATVAAVKGFQGKRAIPVTGEVDQRTWSRLTGMTRTPTADELANRTPKPSVSGLDSRCMSAGAVLCISKSTSRLVYLIDGKPQLSFAVRFGSQFTPTREGTFHVFMKSRNHVSTIYHTAMPFAMFFSGGQAVHYSADFAARGYAGASHGCVNVRDYNGIASLFDRVSIGTKVVVYR